jgi:hypothetical protein
VLTVGVKADKPVFTTVNRRKSDDTDLTVTVTDDTDDADLVSVVRRARIKRYLRQ